MENHKPEVPAASHGLTGRTKMEAWDEPGVRGRNPSGVRCAQGVEGEMGCRTRRRWREGERQTWGPKVWKGRGGGMLLHNSVSGECYIFVRRWRYSIIIITHFEPEKGSGKIEKKKKNIYIFSIQGGGRGGGGGGGAQGD